MTLSSPSIAALRRRIERLTAGPAVHRRRSVVPLGDGLDDALPDGGLELGAVHEIAPAGRADAPAALGFSVALLARIARVRPGPILWAAPGGDPLFRAATYPPGLAAAGLDPSRLIQVTARTAQDRLWAIEESLTTAGFAAVLGIFPADGRHCDFTASRRLSLRAVERGGTALILRGDDLAGATAAVTRWSVAARPSAPVRRRGSSMPGLGPPCWQVGLVRCKRGRPREWLVEWDHEALSFRLAAPLADRVPAPSRPQTVPGNAFRGEVRELRAARG